MLQPKLAAEPTLEQVYREIEIPLVPVLERIESNGVMIDMDELRRQSIDLGRRMLALQQQATELAGRTFNLDSPKQVCALLFDGHSIKSELPWLFDGMLPHLNLGTADGTSCDPGLRDALAATSAQAAEILHDKGLDFTGSNVQQILEAAAPQTKQAFKDYFESLKN